MFKKSLYGAMGIFLLLVVLLFLVSLQQIQHVRRDPITLLNKYYRLKDKHPEAARRALFILLEQDHNNLAALEEASRLYVHEQNLPQAISVALKLHLLKPNNTNYSLQLASLYYDVGDWKNAELLYQNLEQQSDYNIQNQAKLKLAAMASYLPYWNDNAKIDRIEPQNREAVIEQVHFKPVPSVQSYLKKPVFKVDNRAESKLYNLKKLGYIAISQHRTRDALIYFNKAYQLTHDPNLAMQLGYLYDELGDKPTAYRYFKEATYTENSQLALCAENAMTNLRCVQTKALPKPYFSEFFFTPFTQSRFGLTVRPIVGRVGVEQTNRFNTKEYFVFRRTDDNKSKNLGQISQIYEDDVQIEGVGVQIQPVRSWPIIGFLEAGAAYDLVYQNRDRWRGDVRGGFMYYADFGYKPAYVDKLTWSANYYGDWYTDAIYFSRYNNNVIGGVITHQGIRLLQYKSSMLNVYVTGRALADTNRLFYNNFVEIGPGIAFVPSNRFNIQLRYEHLNGAYLPAGAVTNPYPQYYINNVVQLLCYVKI